MTPSIAAGPGCASGKHAMARTDHVTQCGRPCSIGDEDLVLDALDRLADEVAVLRLRVAELRESRTCARCRRKLRPSRWLLTVGKVSMWVRVLCP
jgi:hypothetical protein